MFSRFNTQLVKNLGTLVSGTALSQFISLILTPILGRMFSPDEYGRLGIFLAVVATVSTVGALRYDMAIMLPKDEGRGKLMVRLSFRILLIVSILTSLICLLGQPIVARIYQDSELAWWLVASGLGVFLVCGINILTYWYNRTLRYGPIARNRVVQNGGAAIAQLGLGVARLTNLIGLTVGYLLGNLAAFLVMVKGVPELKGYLFNWKSDHGRSKKPNSDGQQVVSPEAGQRSSSTPSLRQLMRRYRKMPLVNAPNALLDSFRTNGISALIGTVALGALGQYQMAVRIIQAPVLLINQAVSQVFFQRLTEVPRGKMRSYSLRCMLVLGAIQTVPFILIYLLAPSFMPWFVGERWADAGYYARALIPWLYMSSITSPITTLFVVVEKQQVILIHSIFFTIVPIGILLWAPGNFLTTLWVMSSAMGVLLLILMGLALWCADGYDRSPLPAEEAGEERR